MSAELPDVPAHERRFDPRVWAVVAGATLIATLAGMPYGEFLVAQGPAAASPIRDPFLRLALQVALTVLVTWPLAALGLALGARLGLGAPLLSAWLDDRLAPGQARRTLLPAALAGATYGASLLLLFAVFRSAIDAQMVRLGPPPVAPPAWAGVLASFAAGISEETLLRLFLLSLIALPLAGALPRAGALWIANAASALVFGALHFGNVVALGLSFTPFLVAFILVVNGGVGLLCGWLYWTRGIEAAMACHVAVDLFLHGLGPALGAAGRA